MPETPSAPGAGAAGVIHDIGYQRYEGPRLGRAYAARSLFVQSVRGAYGLGRSAWAKVLPIGLLSIASMAALILVVVNTQLPVEVIDYVGIASTFTYASTVFVAVVAPELVSVDLRTNLLSLYLSRPITRTDYALTKLASLAAATFVMLGTPMLVLFLGMAFSTDNGIAGVFSEFGGLLQGLVAAAIHAAVLASIALPFASLTGRRVFATGMIIGVTLLTAPISGVLIGLGGPTTRQLAGLIDPVSLLNGVDRWLFDGGIFDVGPYGPVYGAGALLIIGLGTVCTVWRYRKVKS
jgi:ABC-2 type transport system permease protein